jgi:uncharacterized protein (TIGR02391 family)
MIKKRRVPNRSEIELKDFTPEEIERGIEKLKRRIAEVNNLLKDGIQFDDKTVDNVVHFIRDTIREIFGQNSPQFRDHEHHAIWHGDHNMVDSWPERQAKFEAGIPQTVKMLNGLISWLEEKSTDRDINPINRIKAAFQEMDLHPRIASACSDLYRDGHYENAVFNASKALINFVREKSGRHDLDGVDLMRKVFSKNDPILSFNNLSDQSDLDEQEGMMHLFEGAVLGIRNPRGHSFYSDSPERALEYIGLLNLLANMTVEAKRV